MTDSATFDSKNRIREIQSVLKERNLDSYLAVGETEVRYLSNFGGEDAWLYIPAAGKSTLITDFRFAEDVRADSPHLRHILRSRGLVDELARLRKSILTIAFDPDQVTVALRHRLAKALGAANLKPLPGLVSGLRAIKSENEVRLINRALRIAEKAYAEFVANVTPGMSEIELAAELEYRMRRCGSQGNAFPTISAVGPNASKPHARPGSRRLPARSGLLLTDFGATFGGYRCDLTRVLLLGRIPPEIGRAYNAVLKAQLAAIDAVRDGVKSSQVDAAARDTLTEMGYGELFGHGTGHGLGLQTHEAPAVSPRAGSTVLRSGMVITIEPGVYLPGGFGIRIEDDVLVTDNGCRVLSRLPKTLDSPLVART